MVLSEKTILAIDTAGPYLGVALLHQKQLYQEHWQGDSKQQEVLTPAMQRLIDRAGIESKDLDIITVMQGPGTFTGLRVGMACGKAIAYALKKPLVSISTLVAYNVELMHKEYSVTILDARKGRYYAQLFYYGKPLSDAMDADARTVETLMLEHGDVYWHLTGYGVENFIKDLPETKLTFSFLANSHQSKAECLLALAWDYYQEYGSDALAQGPSYLRLSEAELSLEQKEKEC